MKISELIARLSTIYAEAGDIFIATKDGALFMGDGLLREDQVAIIQSLSLQQLEEMYENQ